MLFQTTKKISKKSEEKNKYFFNFINNLLLWCYQRRGSCEQNIFYIRKAYVNKEFPTYLDLLKLMRFRYDGQDFCLIDKRLEKFIHYLNDKQISHYIDRCLEIRQQC